jgi:hypothetical protein
MSAKEFTPGPWCVAPLDGVYHGDDAKTKYHAVKKYWPMPGAYERIADCSDSANPVENARLIAAAPDLLAASADFLQWFETFIGKPTFSDIECSELTALRAAISKATGVPHA